MFDQQLEIELKATKMTNQGTERYSSLSVKKQNGNELKNEKRKKNMVANLDVNNLKWEWGQQTNRDRYV